MAQPRLNYGVRLQPLESPRGELWSAVDAVHGGG